MGHKEKQSWLEIQNFWKGVVQFQILDKISVDWIISLENLM